MKSFAAILALTATLASAIEDVDYEDIWHDIFHDDEYHHHHEHWEECKEQIALLNEKLAALDGKDNAAAVQIASIQSTIDVLQCRTPIVHQEAVQNLAAAAGLQAKVQENEDIIDCLENSVTELCDELDALEPQIQTLQAYVDGLPDFTSIIAQINAVQTIAQGIHDSAVAAQPQADALATPIATNLAAAQALDISAVQAQIQGIQDGVDMLQMMDDRRLELDFWTSNASTLLSLPNGTTELLDFCVDSGKTMEFNLSLTATPVASGYLRKVALLQDGTEVAVEEISSIINTDRNRAFNLFYKFDADPQAGPFNYSIEFTVESEEPVNELPILEPGALEWGYKVYSTGYALEQSPNTTCV